MKLLYCDDVGNMYDYVGCNINVDDGFNFTYPVMLQVFKDEFSLPKLVSNTPEITGKTLTKSTGEDVDPPK